MFSCAKLLLAAALAVQIPAFSVRGEAVAVSGDAPDTVVSRLRIGPFFEFKKTNGGGVFWAIRPFYARVHDPEVSKTHIDDIVWPFYTYHRDREESWWRAALIAYGSNDNIYDEDSGWKAVLFPLYCQGRTREGEDYWALFPFYGHVPHILLMDDIDFTLFPIYMNYEVNGIERRSYLWPIFQRRDNEVGETRTGVFPFYGERKYKGVSSKYAFWPFWTSAINESGANTGESWMLWPLYGRVDREREQQTLVLPPFFSHATADQTERWRLPWPFYETVKSPREQKRSYWPFYGDTRSEDEFRCYAAWPLISAFSLDSRGKRTERCSVFPFYMNQKTYRKNQEGRLTLEEDYLRIWPFYSKLTRANGDSHLRALELMPIRYAPAVDRNWAPFWTFYEKFDYADRTEHDALWGIIKYTSAK